MYRPDVPPLSVARHESIRTGRYYALLLHSYDKSQNLQSRQKIVGVGAEVFSSTDDDEFDWDDSGESELDETEREERQKRKLHAHHTHLEHENHLRRAKRLRKLLGYSVGDVLPVFPFRNDPQLDYFHWIKRVTGALFGTGLVLLAEKVASGCYHISPQQLRSLCPLFRYSHPPTVPEGVSAAELTSELQAEALKKKKRPVNLSSMTDQITQVIAQATLKDGMRNADASLDAATHSAKKLARKLFEGLDEDKGGVLTRDELNRTSDPADAARLSKSSIRTAWRYRPKRNAKRCITDLS
ncbi:hypothetical protein KEM48_011446 [Puccinia striiformis f. sp. tritici PST-130]|nr:hypothetical protein KEM48_011446 [Puccinia striiformis f. sp. tritici PST-130]